MRRGVTRKYVFALFVIIVFMVGTLLLVWRSRSTMTNTHLPTGCGFPVKGTALYVRLIRTGNGTLPIAGQHITGTLNCNTQFFFLIARAQIGPQTYVTNGSGYVTIPSPDGSYYVFSTTFSNQSYRFDGTILPFQTTYDTLSLPVGIVRETVCNDMTNPRTCSTTTEVATISEPGSG